MRIMQKKLLDVSSAPLYSGFLVFSMKLGDTRSFATGFHHDEKPSTVGIFFNVNLICKCIGVDPYT
jgi:hypothetical protein